MIVTKFNYPLEKGIVKKVDLMIKRCTQKNPKRDAVLLEEGAEGEGKTSSSIAIAYYVADRTGRPFNHTHVFFDLSKMIKFLQSTEDQIAIWDEPALQALSGDYASSLVKDLTRLLMMCRKKRHFIIINLTYFNKFSDYIVWQRPLGMIHMYSRNNVEPGRFVFIRKKNLEHLWNDWKMKKRRDYRKWCSRNIRGTFPDVLNPDYKNNVLSDFDINYYEKEKDKAIQMIGTRKTNKDKAKLQELKYKIATLKLPTEIKEKIAKQLGYSYKTLEKWRERYTHSEDTPDKSTDINIKGMDDGDDGEGNDEKDI